ncbi:bifunctional folylpolyglutamate synthase/dihydrofolate synthase [Haematospirillum sp. 15-248]|uniref:bifunctional folylpolyglutamate synthase/dihydrofolate synthase n=1 Tax=Haematospirillum sp. 15-248 TaxID=2723107 RepID=UPI0014392D6E|nr:folylpolyglutamate synthase/dihydrofolate synthase family protein [Haematospirillum sp. 15-248]NKD88074.1 bifunctional folylpolyglutamate synthase/dihydrofolate synthase [Haematospirillum sp. 15-248]
MLVSPPAVGPDRVLERLTALHPKAIDLSLDRMWSLLDRLGNPQNALPPVVHVAGTNGKGSTIATMRALLEAGGLRVHVYTSPHLVRFNERIVLSGSRITDQALSALLEEVEACNARQPITFFEVTTAAAFLAFSRVPADVVLLETGLGGRLDATNVVKKPSVTVLTSISLDHQAYLGDTVAAIAAEKAGIMRAGVPCISMKQKADVLPVLEFSASAIGAPILLQGRDFSGVMHDQSLVYTGLNGSVHALPAPVLPGGHQAHNTTLALAVIEHLGMVPSDVWGRGLSRVVWPARLQHLVQGPLSDLLPKGWDLWLDGGHNPDAGLNLADHVCGQWQDRPLDLVIGMIDTKDEGGFLAPLARVASRIRTVPVHGSLAGRSPEHLAQVARSLGVEDTAACADVSAALASLAATAGDSLRRVLICGSLYLAGDVLARNGGC